MFKARDYQEIGVGHCVDILQSKKQCREIVVAPTAAGKSWYTAETARRVDEPLIVIQPSKELLKQNYEKFIKVGGKATICCASLKTKTVDNEEYTEIDGELVRCREISKVTFATVGTVIKYVDELKKLGVKKIILDEAHLMTQSNTQKKRVQGKYKTVEKQSQIKKLVKKLGVTNIVGLTATALYLKGGMGGSSLKIMTRVKWKLFTDIRHVTQISELVDKGYWSKLVYQVNDTDETSLQYNTTGSDYTVESLRDFYESNDLKEQIVEEIRNLQKEGRKSILVFLPTIKDADDLFSIFPNSAVVHSKMDDKVRDYVIDAFRDLTIPVVFNVNILSVGFDHPQLDAIITARPTNSISIFYQQIGRGVRIHPEKNDCKIVDFSGNVKSFGKVEELEYCNLEEYGWGLFNGRGELLTDYPLNQTIRPTKESILNKNKEKKEKEFNKTNPEFYFGMFKGRRIWDIAKSEDAKRFHSYCGWLYGEYQKGKWKFIGDKAEQLRDNIEEYLKEKANTF